MKKRNRRYLVAWPKNREERAIMFALFLLAGLHVWVKAQWGIWPWDWEFWGWLRELVLWLDAR